ncbi:MAG: NAD-dependent epimerase/dehydratase family protein [Chloroflexaceae bacterium]
MRVLITGGAGGVARYQAHTLARQGFQVDLLDIKNFRQEEYPAGVTRHPGDLRDHQVLSRLCAGRDAIIYPVALPANQSAAHAAIAETHALLEAAHQHAVPRLICISATAVYALPQPAPITEAAPLSGSGLYGRTCLAVERLCEAYRARGQHITILRAPPGVVPDQSEIWTILFDRVRRGRRIPVIGAGDTRYQMLAGADLTQAVLLLLTGPSTCTNDTFNIGAQRFGMLRQDLRALCDYAGNGARVLPTPAGPSRAALRLLAMLRLAPLLTQLYLTSDWNVSVSTAKLEQVLGWQPRYSNAEALIHAYQDYLDQDETQPGSGRPTSPSMVDSGLLRCIRRFLV